MPSISEHTVLQLFRLLALNSHSPTGSTITLAEYLRLCSLRCWWSNDVAFAAKTSTIPFPRHCWF